MLLHDFQLIPCTAEKAGTESSKPRGWCPKRLAQSHQVSCFVFKTWSSLHFSLRPEAHCILPRDGIALKKTEAKEAQENKQGQVTIHCWELCWHVWTEEVVITRQNSEISIPGSVWRGNNPGSQSGGWIFWLGWWSFRFRVWLRRLG